MIDSARGTLSFDDQKELVGPGLTEADFLRSSIGRRAAPLVRDGEHSSWKVQALSLAGREVAVGFYFRHAMLWRVDFCLCDERFGRTWDDWTEEKELARKGEHDRCLIMHSDPIGSSSGDRLSQPTTQRQAEVLFG